MHKLNEENIKKTSIFKGKKTPIMPVLSDMLQREQRKHVISSNDKVADLIKNLKQQERIVIAEIYILTLNTEERDKKNSVIRMR